MLRDIEGRARIRRRDMARRADAHGHASRDAIHLDVAVLPDRDVRRLPARLEPGERQRGPCRGLAREVESRIQESIALGPSIRPPADVARPTAVTCEECTSRRSKSGGRTAGADPDDDASVRSVLTCRVAASCCKASSLHARWPTDRHLGQNLWCRSLEMNRRRSCPAPIDELERRAILMRAAGTDEDSR